MPGKLNPLDDSEILKDWMRRNPAIAHEVLVELDTDLLALMIHDPWFIGGYLIKQFKEAKQEQEEMADLPPEISEEALDRRERARDMAATFRRGILG